MTKFIYINLVVGLLSGLGFRLGNMFNLYTAVALGLFAFAFGIYIAVQSYDEYFE